MMRFYQSFGDYERGVLQRSENGVESVPETESGACKVTG